MPKRLVVCCDGTWNDPNDKTHIHWICEHCQREDADPLPQDVKYVAGVGTTPGERVKGGALGLGLSRNVREGYRFLRDRWEPGDEIFIFGFSRGAYTARSLSGFLSRVGLLDADDWVDRAYLWYRLAPPPSAQDQPSSLLRAFADLFDFTDELGEAVGQHIRHRPEINLLGVFDTVGSLGVPFNTREFQEDLGANLEADGVFQRLGGRLLGLIGRIEERVRRPIEGFHDTELGAHVRNAYHALAIDERREPFLPTLWTKIPRTSTVEQAWFAGVHGDIGGGYREDADQGRLAEVPLLWMMDKAAALGLDLKPGTLEGLRETANELAPQHESFSDSWEVLGRILHMDAEPRPIFNEARRRKDPSGRKFPFVEANETIHSSVRRRLRQKVEIRRKDAASVLPEFYAPKNLPVA